MKNIRLLIAAVLSLLGSAAVPAEPKPLPWLLAQSIATCELENRRVPAGTRLCSQGHWIECSPRGTWQNTGKEC
jgi:hypothetical protein